MLINLSFQAVSPFKTHTWVFCGLFKKVKNTNTLIDCNINVSVICSAHWSDDDVLSESLASLYFVSSLLDFDRDVHFYWMRGERIIPKGHRKGHLEPTRFQIDDRPNSQIRITQQLPQVQ